MTPKWLGKVGTKTAPKRLGKAGNSKIIGHLDGIPVVTVEDPRKVIKLVNSNGPDGNYMEYDDGYRVSLSDARWRVELSRLLERPHAPLD